MKVLRVTDNFISQPLLILVMIVNIHTFIVIQNIIDVRNVQRLVNIVNLNNTVRRLMVVFNLIEMDNANASVPLIVIKDKFTYIAKQNLDILDNYVSASFVSRTTVQLMIRKQIVVVYI
ncbi:hypothetical protein SS50377_26335 [Spironucleus salmonicida]|uniref:Uncharacterized protein n=1 Tax=Spironucleus salmonicida TaxID=348837 RepID=V6LVR4_9EUKA|nr:hypothetical protein SS50377_26335 [Spironucleus salmonicida]|eukprot:EST47796.1 Hypothetical protein SS50377_12197 [Spironucleus salmonicida]